MSRPPLAGRVAIFAVVVALLLAGGAALGTTSTSSVEDTPVDYPAVDGLVPEALPAEDDAEPVRAEERQVVVVDEAHANRLIGSEYDPFRSAFGANTEIRFLRDGSQIRSSLAGADAFVVADPSLAYTSEELDAVEAFVDDGGRLVVLGEPTRYRVTGPIGAPLPVRSRVDRLSNRFGISFGTGYLYDQSNNDGNFKRVLARGSGPLADRRAALYTATTVRASAGQVLLRTPGTTRYSDGSGAGARPVAVRSGNVLAVGDTTFLEGEKDLVADNERLVATIARFAIGGERSRSLTEYPHLLERAPAVRYTSPALLNASVRAANDLRADGFEPTVTLGAAGPEETDVLVATYDELDSGTDWTGVSVSGSRVSVSGYEGDRADTTIIHHPEGTDSVVVVGPTAEAVQRAVDVFVEDRVRAEAISDRTVVLRNGASEADIGAPAGSDGGDETDGPTGPAGAPSLAWAGGAR